MKIESVECWHVDRGVSHAVAMVEDPGCYTACGTLHWGVFPKRGSKHNGRICAKCRERLATMGETGGANADAKPKKAAKRGRKGAGK